MFTLTAHFGFVVKGNPHLDNFLKLCAIIQMIGYSIQFEYVLQNGTVRPCIEVPLIDNKLTAQQLLYCVDEMLRTVDKHYPALKKVLETGELPADVQKVLDGQDGNGDTDRL